MPDLWDSPKAVAAWLDFNARIPRYQQVNQALAEHAQLLPGDHVLDLGAGTGGTALACLRAQALCQVRCVEPALAMRRAGLQDPRVSWVEEVEPGPYARVLCGSSVWLMGPIPHTLAHMRSLLAPGGALLFAIPGAYVGVPDSAGQGPDPWLSALPQAIVRGRTRAPLAAAPKDGGALPDVAAITALLKALGMRVQRWQLQTRWDQQSMGAWLALPPIAGAMRPDLSPSQASERVRELCAEMDDASWRMEGWQGWTAWL